MVGGLGRRTRACESWLWRVLLVGRHAHAKKHLSSTHTNHTPRRARVVVRLRDLGPHHDVGQDLALALVGQRLALAQLRLDLFLCEKEFSFCVMMRKVSGLSLLLCCWCWRSGRHRLLPLVRVGGAARTAPPMPRSAPPSQRPRRSTPTRSPPAPCRRRASACSGWWPAALSFVLGGWVERAPVTHKECESCAQSGAGRHEDG